MNGILDHGIGLVVKHFRVIVGLAIVTGLALHPVAAQAKGPSRVVLDGPGVLGPLELDRSFVVESGLFLTVFCAGCDGHLPGRPSGQLGPRYRLTYTMTFTTGSRTYADDVVEYLFPFAAPRPATFVPAGQRFWMQVSVASWSEVRQGVRRYVVSLGVPRPGVSPPASDVIVTVESQWPPLLVPVLAILFLMLVAGGFLVVNHRRRQLPSLRA